MFCAIEDASFEVRRTLVWTFGSGFPKSLNVSKKINETIPSSLRCVCDAHLRDKASSSQSDCRPSGDSYDEQLPTGQDGISRILHKCNRCGKYFAGDGVGSDLKPAAEFICLARKPLDAGFTIAANVLRWGVGGLNIDACRIGTEGGSTQPSGMDRYNAKLATQGYRPNEYQQGEPMAPLPAGRFPANLIHDGSPEVLAEFAKAGQLKSGVYSGKRNFPKTKNAYGKFDLQDENPISYGDSGSAARFFASCPFQEEDLPAFVYFAKASRAERDAGLSGMPTYHNADLTGGDRNKENDRAGTNRNGPIKCSNNHPCVKPLSLMRYLCRLITPPGGLILDPFGGSGTTGLAAIQEGFHYVLIEQQAEYCDIARKRIAAIPRRLEEWA
jgi:site-specific DNA-methyltransferase (adenine-specific)